MTQVKTRKQRVIFTVELKLDYVKLMVNEGYDIIIQKYQDKPDLFLENTSHYCMGLNS